MKLEMEGVNVNMNKMSEAFTKIVDERQSREKKFEKLFLRINDDIRTRDKRIEARIDRIEKHIDAKIEKFSDIEARMSAVEKNKSGANEKTCREEHTKENARTVPIEYKAVVHSFQDDRQRRRCERCRRKSIKTTGMKDVEYTIDCPAKPITHVFVEFHNMKIRDRYVRSAGMQKAELNGRTVRISPVLDAEERFHRKRMGYI